MSEQSWSQRRTSFGNAASDYASGRPHYPRDALQWCLPQAAQTVLDLGAGTGILTSDLLDLGLDVISVEPLAEMRALVPTTARAVAGTAEAIPLPDASVDAVFVGQAWHWFDVPRALAETHRVLRQGGSLGLLWNLLDTQAALTRTIADIVDADERSDMMLDGEVEPPYDGTDRYSPPEQLLVAHAESYDIDRVREFALSRSQAILLDGAGRQQLVEQLRDAVPEGPFAINWLCEAWRATAL